MTRRVLRDQSGRHGEAARAGFFDQECQGPLDRAHAVLGQQFRQGTHAPGAARWPVGIAGVEQVLGAASAAAKCGQRADGTGRQRGGTVRMAAEGLGGGGEAVMREVADLFLHLEAVEQRTVATHMHMAAQGTSSGSPPRMATLVLGPTAAGMARTTSSIWA